MTDGPMTDVVVRAADSGGTRPPPDVDTMFAWLQSERVVGRDGAVRSWDNPANPGYSYPEISGLLLSLLARSDSGDPEVRDRIAENVCRGVGEITLRVGGKDGGPQMLARAGRIEVRAVAIRRELLVLPIQAHVVVARTPDPGLHSIAGAAMDANATLVVVALPALPDRRVEIAGQSG